MPGRSRRERELARRRYERQQARRAERRTRRRRVYQVVAAVTAAVVVLGGAAFGIYTAVSGGGGKSAVAAGATPKASATPSAAFSPQPCAYTPSKGGKVTDVGTPSAAGLDTSTPYTMTITTNRGTITAKLDTAAAPCTVNSFRFLASKNYFDHTKCHRLVTSGIFVLQCGDPSATGTGGPGYQFPDENLDAFGPAHQQVTYPKGTIAMANAGPGTNGSQFFIVYKDSPLAASYTPFGTVTSGLDIVQKVAAAGTASDGTAPKLPVTIEDLTVSKA